MNIINYKSLLNYNTFKIDVTADFFSSIKSESDLHELLDNKQIKKKKKFIIGGGSNILLTKNINGLIIHNQIKGIQIIKESDKKIEIEVGGGEVWDDVVKWSTENNFYGIENLSLIPGLMGAAPIQNIGAYGCELKDSFQKLEAINLKTTEKIIFHKSDCFFGYRDSIFKHELKNKFIITKVYLKLMKFKNININYQALKDKIQSDNINSQNIREIIINIRNSKLPDTKKIGNAGSFFKNPIINKKQLERLKQEYPKIPVFQDTIIKIPAAWLIEKLNWKGYKNKNCGVFNKHALIIVNHNNATGKEIVNLAKKIKYSVYKKFDILLEEEVTII